MQRALWPATLGYWMDKLLSPVFGDDAVDSARWFFSEYVSGRGPVPALRIGGQPYGILPTTAFSRIRWLDSEAQRTGPLIGGAPGVPARLLAVLRAIDPDWAAMSGAASLVGKPGDAHQILLDIVGLHPSLGRVPLALRGEPWRAVQPHQSLGTGTRLRAGHRDARARGRRHAATRAPRLRGRRAA